MWEMLNWMEKRERANERFRKKYGDDFDWDKWREEVKAGVKRLDEEWENILKEDLT